jgi:hypothetical protein
MEKTNNNSSGLNKIKNKKKDIITVDNTDINVNKTHDDVKEKENIKDDNKNEINKEEVVNTDIIVEKVEKENATTPLKNTNELESSESNKSLINKIIYNFQLLLSLSKKVDDKLINFASLYLSLEHFEAILEERDCKGICGNMLCGSKLDKSKQKKYYYNSNTKQFSKNDIDEYFCDIKCFQKFKDVLQIAKTFDYFRLLNLETLIIFSILPEYYPSNKYLDEITKNAKIILEKNRKIDDKNFPELLSKIKKKYDKYFLDEEFEEDKETAKEEIGKSFDKMFDNMNITK